MKLVKQGKLTEYPFLWTCPKCKSQYEIGEDDIVWETVIIDCNPEPAIICSQCRYGFEAPLTPISKHEWINKHTKKSFFGKVRI